MSNYFQHNEEYRDTPHGNSPQRRGACVGM